MEYRPSQQGVGLLALVLLSPSILAAAQDYACSDGKSCKLGYRFEYGVCGFRPSYAGEANCRSSYDAKSECEPGLDPGGPPRPNIL